MITLPVSLPRRSLRLVAYVTLAAILIAVAVARAQATAVPPATAATAAPTIAPQRPSVSLVLHDDAPWEQRAVWWNPTWRYRIPVDVQAPATLTDAVVNFSVDWNAVLAAAGAAGPLDGNSLRLVEYTPGGHIVPSYGARHPGDLGCNRFDRVPVAVRGGDPNALWALVPNTTAAGSTRRFFLYFDTTENPKPAKDYHYLTATDSAAGLRLERTGPDTECNVRPLAMVFAKGSPSGINAVTGVAARFLYPALSGSGPCSGDLVAAASYTTGNTVPAIDVGASFSGAAGGCGNLSGSGGFTAGTQILAASMGAAVQGSITLTPSADVQVNAGQTLTLVGATTATASSDAWYSDGGGVVRTFTGASAGFPGPGAHIGTRAGATTLIRIDDAAVPAVFGGGSNLQALRPDRTSIRVAAPSGGGTWRAGEPLTVRFTLVWAATTLDAQAAAEQLASVFTTGNVTVGSPRAYSEELLEAQFRYYENKGWDYVQNTLLTTGWTQPWNITYGYDLDTGKFEQAHHNDSSMGAGFLLYAAALKAAITGEPRYYDIANAYVNYFLQLEAADIAQYGPQVAGRIAYGYNGGDTSIVFGPCTAPARGIPDCTSIDQMATAALGLWQYVNLDPTKIALNGPARALLGRMTDYVEKGGPNLKPQPEFLNLRPLLGLGGPWLGSSSNFPPNGFVYTKWLARTTGEINTGGTANSFYIAGFGDKILARKLPERLAVRHRSIVRDTGTATRGYYPIVRGVSHPPSWGWADWEFPIVGMMKTTTRGLVWQDSEPQNYQLIGGGMRDSISGRMTQQATVVLWAALEEPEARMDVAGQPGPLLYEYARHSLHTTIALLMHDNGGIRDGALGVMGRASAVNDSVLTADFSGYYLLLMAQYRLWHGDVGNPMPANRYDYIQGIAERDGVTTVTYLGDQQFLQRSAWPNNGWPVLNSGVIPTPTLTYRPDGTAAEFFGTTLFLPVALTYGAPQTGTLRQVPMVIAPESGTAAVTMQAYEPGDARLALTAAPGQRVAVRFGWITPGSLVRLARNGTPLAEAAANGAGEAAFTIEGDGMAAVLEARW